MCMWIYLLKIMIKRANEIYNPMLKNACVPFLVLGGSKKWYRVYEPPLDLQMVQILVCMV